MKSLLPSSGCLDDQLTRAGSQSRTRPAVGSESRGLTRSCSYSLWNASGFPGQPSAGREWNHYSEIFTAFHLQPNAWCTRTVSRLVRMHTCCAAQSQAVQPYNGTGGNKAWKPTWAKMDRIPTTAMKAATVSDVNLMTWELKTKVG